MKIIAALLISAVSSANAFAPRANASAFRTQLDAVKIYYDTQTGNTETCAGYIAAAAGLEAESIGMSQIFCLQIALFICCHVFESISEEYKRHVKHHVVIIFSPIQLS